MIAGIILGLGAVMFTALATYEAAMHNAWLPYGAIAVGVMIIAYLGDKK